MKRVLLNGLFFLLCASLLQAQEAKPTISVLDFQLSGISVQEGRMIIDYMSSGIVETGQFRVIDRMQRESLMKEIEFSNAGCTDEACQLKIGKLLSASMIIVGSLGKIGDLYMLNLKMINVETSETVKTASSTYDNLNALVKDNPRLTFAFLGREAPAAASGAAAGAASSAASGAAAKPAEPAKTEATGPAAPAKPEVSAPAVSGGKAVEQPTVAAAARALTEAEIRGRDRAFWTTVAFDSAQAAAFLGVGIGLNGNSTARVVLPGILAVPPVGPFLSGDLASGIILSGIKAASTAVLAVFFSAEVGIATAAVDVGIAVWDIVTVGGAMERMYRNAKPLSGSVPVRPLTLPEVQDVDAAYWITFAGDLSESLLAASFLAGAFNGWGTYSQMIGTIVASALPPIGPFFSGDLGSGLILSGIKAASGVTLMAMWSSSYTWATVGGFVSVAVNIWDILAIGDAMERKLRGTAARAEAPRDAVRVTLQPVYGKDGRMNAVRLLAAVRL